MCPLDIQRSLRRYADERSPNSGHVLHHEWLPRQSEPPSVLPNLKDMELDERVPLQVSQVKSRNFSSDSFPS